MDPAYYHTEKTGDQNQYPCGYSNTDHVESAIALLSYSYMHEVPANEERG